VQAVSINGIEFDAMISESKGYSATIPDYPVEGGFNVSDAIMTAPLELAMTLFVGNSVTFRQHRGRSINDVVKQLEDLFFSGKLVTVITSTDTYKDYGILAMSIGQRSQRWDSRNRDGINSGEFYAGRKRGQ
jgi:hypothetical protein